MKFLSLEPNEGDFPRSYRFKKWRVVVGNRTIYFGDNRYQDYTQHRDKTRKQRYLLRHSKTENWDDPTTAGFWATNLLWNKPTIPASLSNIFKRFPELVQ